MGRPKKEKTELISGVELGKGIFKIKTASKKMSPFIKSDRLRIMFFLLSYKSRIIIYYYYLFFVINGYFIAWEEREWKINC